MGLRIDRAENAPERGAGGLGRPSGDRGEYNSPLSPADSRDDLRLSEFRRSPAIMLRLSEFLRGLQLLLGSSMF